MVSKSGRQSLVSGHARRAAILRAVPELEQFLGRSPSLREIADAVQVKSKNAVREHIDRLVADGLLVKDERGQVHRVANAELPARVDESRPYVTQVAQLHARRMEIDAAIERAAIAAKLNGASWSELGQALGGLAPSAAFRRYRDKLDQEVPA